METLTDLANLLHGQPAVYAILLALLWGLKTIIPIAKRNIELKQATLDCLIRMESGNKDNALAIQENTRAIKSLETKIVNKDDVINILLKNSSGSPQTQALNGSGSIVKQGV